MPGERASRAVAGTRFAGVRWVAETGSTNADLLALARHGAPEGVVAVADHQTAGRGRKGRSWKAPPGSSLLWSVLLRPPARVIDATTMAVAVAVAEAVQAVTGVAAGLKWPNDLVVAVEGTDRKLAGILAEVDWPAGSNIAGGWRAPEPTERGVVVVGVGCNVNWPDEAPAGGIALNRLVGHDVDREDLLAAALVRLDARYSELLADGGRDRVGAAWRERSATLGRRVRIDLGAHDVVGTAVDVTTDGHLVVDTDAGDRRTFAVGDVVHLRPG